MCQKHRLAPQQVVLLMRVASELTSVLPDVCVGGFVVAVVSLGVGIPAEAVSAVVLRATSPKDDVGVTVFLGVTNPVEAVDVVWCC